MRKKGWETRYKAIYVNGKRIREHQAIFQNKLGRKLKRGEIVHHINHNPRDNRISNLKLMTKHEHMVHHREYNKSH